jgi:hypothetical protein
VVDPIRCGPLSGCRTSPPCERVSTVRRQTMLAGRPSEFSLSRSLRRVDWMVLSRKGDQRRMRVWPVSWVCTAYGLLRGATRSECSIMHRRTRMPTVSLTGVFVVLLACGGAIRAPSDDASMDRTDATGASDAALDSGADTNRRCATDTECWGNQTCQQGICCNGKVVDDKCACGADPGCDLGSVCCFWPCDGRPPKCTPISGCALCPGK